MKRQGSLGLVTVVTLLVLACAEARPVPTPPHGPAAAPDASTGSIPDASQASPIPPPDAGEAPDAAAPPAVEWKLIDRGSTEKGQAGRCGPTARFASLESVLGKPAPGPIAVRGRAWLPATYPCTAAIPETCHATPVLAPSRPKHDASSRAQIFLYGTVAPYEPWACTGRHGDLRCALPLEGREYGVTGTLRVSLGHDERPLLELDVEKLCRFP